MKAKQKKKKNKLIYKIIVSILFIASILFVIGLMCLNVLSIKWFMLVLGVLLIIDFLLWLFIIKSKKKKTSSFIAILFTLILSLGSFYIFKTNGLLTDVVSNYKTYNYSVLVLNDIGYTKIKELDNKVMGYLDNDAKEEKQSLEHIKNKITPDLKDYEDIEQMGNDLLTQNVDSILIEDSYLSMLKEENSKYETDCKVIYTFKVRVKIENLSKDVDVTKKAFSIYVSGIDTYGTVDSVSRSDVNLIVTVNPKTKQILMTSIPRDCEIELHKNGKMDKLTHTGIYGVEETISTIEDFLDLDVNYYARTNFSGITNIIDALGGVTVDSDYEFTTRHGNYHIVKGENELDGDKGLCFVRERYNLPSGDYDRGRNQQKLLKAMLNKAMSPKIITNFQRILTAIEGCFETNMSSDEIKSLINMQLDDNAEWDVFNVQLDGKGYMTDQTYSMHGTSIYVMKPYASYVKKITKLIDRVENGDKITENDVKGLGGE